MQCVGGVVGDFATIERSRDYGQGFVAAVPRDSARSQPPALPLDSSTSHTLLPVKLFAGLTHVYLETNMTRTALITGGNFGLGLPHTSG
jgi:hypothetical protein